MGLFSRKEDTRHIKEFDDYLHDIHELAKQFREVHFGSVELFERNFKKEKTVSDMEKERALFEKHLDILQKLKFNSDLLIDEAFKIVRNESALTEKDRQELAKILEKKAVPTRISVGKKKR
jgi:adenylate kinase